MSQIFGVFGHGLIKNNALLSVFLQSYLAKNLDEALSKRGQNSVKIQRIFPIISQVQPNTIMLGWGRKKSYRRASQFVQAHDLAILTLEDGFLRSLTSGKNSRYACSMVIDPIGIYFNAKYPSYLEQLIAKIELNSAQVQTAQRLMQRITAARLSKYNASAKTGTLTNLNIDPSQKNILLIDQVAGDQSITGAGADKDSFVKMLEIAEQNHPASDKCQLWIKAHPAGKVGYLTQINLPKDIKIIRGNINPIELLEHMDEVYTVSSHMGFEALMLEKQVHCFGVPWYAGWGLTDDTHAPKNVLTVAQNRRLKSRQKNGLLTATLQDLFFACYLQYSHYANPVTGKACDIDTAIEWLVTNRVWYQKLPTVFTLYKISFWKKNFIRDFFAAFNIQFLYKPKLEPKTIFSPNHFKFPKNYPFLVWGFAKKQQVQRQLHNAYKAQIWCMEDGFIRSNGLGASLIAPLSVVVDKTGIYYDASAPSDLENLLAKQTELNVAQLDRIKKLQQRLISQQVSKYNVGDTNPLVLPKVADNKEKILVVGQVEDDLSIQRCASDIKTNLELLRQVRQDKPNAFIIYKPHPDVQAGLRVGKISDIEMATYADQIVLDIRMPECLEKVDSVHTISSLTGFEALLRAKSVTCYGLPFYAGWGLTQDKADNAIAHQTLQRRKTYRENHALAALTLSQLIYATLLNYPLYRLPEGYGLAQVEEVIDYLYNCPHLAKGSEKITLPKDITQAKSLLTQTVKPLIKQQKLQLATKFMQLRYQKQFFGQKKSNNKFYN